MNEVLLGPMGRQILQGYGWLLLVFVIAPAVILIPISFSGGSDFTFPPQVLSLSGTTGWSTIRAGAMRPCSASRSLPSLPFWRRSWEPRPPSPSAAWRRTTLAM